MPVTVTADIPDEWNHAEDLPFSIKVNSWHSNFKVTEVRFFVDNQKTSFDEIDEPIYAKYLMQESPIRSWNRLTLNRFTLPMVKRYKVVIPFSQMKEEGIISSGKIVGKIDIRVDHVGSVHRYSSVAFQELGEEYSYHIPFEIILE